MQINLGQKRLNARDQLYIIVEASEPVAKRAKLGDTKMQEILKKTRSNALSALKLEQLLHSRQRKLRLVEGLVRFARF